jgi:hypothetical protein
MKSEEYGAGNVVQSKRWAKRDVVVGAERSEVNFRSGRHGAKGKRGR